MQNEKVARCSVHFHQTLLIPGMPLETPHGDSIGGPIFLPAAPESFEISRAGYDAGAAFKLRSDAVGRVDFLVTFDPPTTVAEKIEMVNRKIDNDLAMFRDSGELNIENETVRKPTDIDLTSKIRSEMILELAEGTLPSGNQFLVRTIVFLDNHFFHV